jgi:hypothetical protein
MTDSTVSRRVWPLALAVLAAMGGSGCTTVLSTASLRDLVLGLDDHSVEPAIPSVADDDAATQTDAEDDSADAERRAAAIEEAIHRLSKISTLDDAARATLVATLQRTDQEDWPVVVDAFAESLAATTPAAHVVAKADLDAVAAPAHIEPVAVPHEPVVAPEPPTPSQNPSKAAAIIPVAAPMPAPEPTPAQEPLVKEPLAISPAPACDPAPEPASATLPDLVIRNACFASRVQAWGVLDRFTADRFRPGQEVIVYFELEGLSAGTSPAGHTTCIDSRLRLATRDGSPVHEWTFEPIAETCRARRHDYFARYMVRIPASAPPGRHRIELAVTDTLSGQQAVETIDLEILAAAHAAE